MKIKRLVICFIVLFLSLSITHSALAEDKIIQSSGFAEMIPKLPKTPNDPKLFNNFVYPPWGPVCQRYTYSVTYKDKTGQKPEYMRIIFNGKLIDMEKQNPNDNDYKNGVQYIYKFVPNKLGSNFYYFEASNGLGKARAGIIDSPDNGPVLFESAFNKNEIAVIDSKTGQKVLSFQTKEEWVGGVALSNDAKYLTAKTFKHIYLFDTSKPEKPMWQYICQDCGESKGGVAISEDGSQIIASIGEKVLAFNKSSNNPVWEYHTRSAYNVAISQDGKYMAVATMGEESNLNSNLLILWNSQSGKPLWQYHSSGNFHDVSLSADGKYIAASTGCPDRRFYVFSRDSNTPLVKSEMLTRDSPVHRAKISADGSLAAVSSESDAGAVFLFKTNSKEPVWKFPTQNGSSVRALNITPDGKFIGAATFGGQAYIFENDKSSPVATWVVNNVALGGVDISNDGSFIAVGGTDKKLHIFEKGKTAGIEILFNEYIEEISISANGKYIATGTGGSVYFFESFNKDQNKIFPCTTIIEPKPQREAMGGGQQATTSLCGDDKCEGPETIGNCRQDCDPNSKTVGGKSFIKNTGIKLPGILTGFGFVGSLLVFGGYFLLIRFNLLKKPADKLLKLNKKIIILLIFLIVLFMFLTVVAFFINKPQSKSMLKIGEQSKPEPGKIILNEDNKPILNQGKNPPADETGVCGNNICEWSLNETKLNCPKDCSAQ